MKCETSDDRSQAVLFTGHRLMPQTKHNPVEDIVKIFAASTLLMAAITRQPIDWSEREPR